MEPSTDICVAHGARRKGNDTLDQVFQLPHIASPFMPQKDVYRLRRQRWGCLPAFLREFLEKMCDEQRNVAGPEAQRRKANGNDVETIIEIFSEGAIGHSFFKLAVRRRNHPHVDFHVLIAAHSAELPLLNDSKELYLYGRRGIANFVQKNGSAVGNFEQTGFVRHRACE